MNEIKTVIEKLKDKKNELEQANAADLESINNKQDNIDTLSKEISDLQNGIEERKKDIATLEQKMSEAESFDKSIVV